PRHWKSARWCSGRDHRGRSETSKAARPRARDAQLLQRCSGLRSVGRASALQVSVKRLEKPLGKLVGLIVKAVFHAGVVERGALGEHVGLDGIETRFAHLQARVSPPPVVSHLSRSASANGASPPGPAELFAARLVSAEPSCPSGLFLLEVNVRLPG